MVVSDATGAHAPAGGRPLDPNYIRNSVNGGRFGCKVHYFPEIDSTNTQARRIAEKGAAEGEIVIAEQQTRGRGRLGRAWISPPNFNIYFSLVLRPKQLLAAEAPQITLMAAVALTETIASLVREPPLIKWPNDILMGRRKIAGILAESSIGPKGIDFVILGIGVNLNLPRLQMPEAIRDRATSLIEFARQPVDRHEFVRRLIQDLERCYGMLEQSGFGALASFWDARSALHEKRVRVEMIDDVIVGTARGIDRDGALLVEDDQGTMRRVVAGDVIPL